MENLDLSVLRTLRDWRSAGLRAMLATVVRTWGSSPRPVGSIMALCETGAVAGSVSGGCIEDDLIAQYTRACQSPEENSEDAGIRLDRPSRRVRYGVSADEAHRFGLPCGGTVELVLEFDPDGALLAQLVDWLESGQLVSRITHLPSGSVSLRHESTPCALVCDDEVQLINTFGPEYRMLIIGAGPLSEYLSSMALFSGFAVTVCDPRQEHAAAWSVPRARLVPDMPDDALRAFGPDRRSCVVAVTHDPKLDDLALMEALRSDAFYVGAMGSRKNNAARRQRLVEHFGLSPQEVQALRGPVGLYIGSKTPPEIAVSIMAEVLAVKNGVALAAGSQVEAAKSALNPDGDPTVCRTL